MERSNLPEFQPTRRSKRSPKGLLSLLPDASDTYTGSGQNFTTTEASSSTIPSLSPPSPTSSMSSTTLPLAPPLPYPLGANPRETMRLAKLALMHEEVQEAEVRRERRTTRRASSLAAGMQGEGSTRRGSRLATGLSSVNEDSQSDDPSPSGRTPHGILRSSLGPDSPSLAGPSTRSSIDSLAPPPHLTPSPLGPRRRSSRVRFCEEPLPSANSTPSTSTPDDAMEELQDPLTPVDETPRLEAPPLVKRDSRSSLASVSSTASDPFGLQCSYGSPVSTTVSRMPSTVGPDDVFLPRALPYPRLSKVLARIHSESPNLEAAIGTAPGESLRELIERPSLVPSVESSLPPPTETLRELIERPSLVPSPGASLLPSSAASSRKASTWSSQASFDPSSRSSACTNSLSAAADLLSRDNSLASGGSSVSGIDLPPRLSALTGVAYASLLPGSTSNSPVQLKTPHLNRQPWVDADMGLSPRSGPSPCPVQPGVMLQAPPVPDLGERPETFQTILPIPPLDLKLPEKVVRTIHADSVDMLPVPQKQHSIASVDAFMAFGVKPADEAPEAGAGTLQDAIALKKGHQRQISDISLDMSFPLPPDRLNLNVTLAKLVTPVRTRKRASLSPAPKIQPVQAVIEEFTEAEARAEEALTSASKAPLPESPTSTLGSIACPSAQTSPCPDAYSLSAAVMQVGSPTSLDTFLPIPVSPTASSSPDSKSSEVCQVPDSPKLEDMIEKTLRARRSTVGYNFNEEDSDLDTSTPLTEVAVKHRIISPNSRLLRGPSSDSRSNRPRIKRLSTTSSLDLKSGVGLTRGMGWSGSESEEEECASTIRSIALRRTSKPNLTQQARMKSRLQGAQSLNSIRGAASRPGAWKSNDRYSQTSSGTSSTNSELSGMTTSTSSSTTMTATELRTPISSLDTHRSGLRSPSYGPHSSLSPSAPGKFPWGGSSPTLSPVKLPLPPIEDTNELIGEASLKLAPCTPAGLLRRRSSGTLMPLPTRDAEWGEPEVMIDEHHTEEEEEEADDGDWLWDSKGRNSSSAAPKIVEVEPTPTIALVPEAATVPTSLTVETRAASDMTPTIAVTPSPTIPMPKPTSRIPSLAKPRSPITPTTRIPSLAKPVTPTPHTRQSRLPSREPDSLEAFVARAMANARASRTPSPASAQTPTLNGITPSASPIPRSASATHRLSLEERLAELVAKRDAAAAAAAGGARPEMAKAKTAPAAVETVPAIVLNSEPVPLSTAAKGKQREMQTRSIKAPVPRRTAAPVCTANRFF